MSVFAEPHLRALSVDELVELGVHVIANYGGINIADLTTRPDGEGRTALVNTVHQRLSDEARRDMDGPATNAVNLLGRLPIHTNDETGMPYLNHLRSKIASTLRIVGRATGVDPTWLACVTFRPSHDPRLSRLAAATLNSGRHSSLTEALDAAERTLKHIDQTR